MTPWKHFPHHEPPEAVPLYTRTWPYPGALVIASYVGGTAWLFSTIPEEFLLPALCVYQWRLAPVPLPDPPVPKPLPARYWREMPLYVPADEALCWVRGLSDLASPHKAQYRADSAGGIFDAVELPGFILPWWGVTLWRPAS
jgi:hypothetical protein